MAKVILDVVQKPLNQRLQKAACIYLGVEEEYFAQKDRKSATNRYMFYYMLYEHAKIEYRQIAGLYDLNVKSVWEGIETIKFRMGMYPTLRNTEEAILSIAKRLDTSVVVMDMQLSQTGDMVERLIQAACIYLNVEESYFARKDQESAINRYMVYYILVVHGGVMYSVIAQRFGLNKKTVWDGIDRIREQAISPTLMTMEAAILKIARNLDIQVVVMDIQLNEKNS